MSDRTMPTLRSDWLRHEGTRQVIGALTANGGRAWFVGGCVRDSLVDPGLDQAELDIDIATDLLPDQTMAAARASGLRAVPTGIAHGTVTVIAAGRPFEVTTLRQDVATDGRHATVVFGTRLEQDAARRDFTINALYAAPDGQVIDPLGGLPDLAQGRVRFVGEPDRRIREDHLRILRFFRFHARFGSGPPDPAGLSACILQRHQLHDLSAERIANELLKLLVARHAVPVMAVMAQGGILEALGLGDADPRKLGDLLHLGQEADALLRLAALFRLPEPTPGAGERLARQLKLSATDRDRLEAMLGRPLPPPAEPIKDLHRRWFYEGVRAWRDRYLLGAALGGAATAGISACLAAAEAWTRPSFPLAGADVLAAGFLPGPEVGRLLREVEAWWLEQDMQPGRERCLEVLHRLLPPLTNRPGNP